MNCFLMHKGIPVAQIELDSATGNISGIQDVLSPDHLPLGTTIKGRVDRAALNGWWIDRSIPASRSGIREALEALQISDTKVLLAKCWGLSLSDQYWVKPTDLPVTWQQVNFFDNTFSEDIGNALFGEPLRDHPLDFQSPDNTSDGCLKKRWKIVEGKRLLMKGGSNPFQQQPFNEVIASRIAASLDIPHADYQVLWSGGMPYSACEDFVTADTELVSAWRVMKSQKQSNSHSVYQHYVKCCADFGVDIPHALDQMMVLDYIIANEDRHQNNFGLLRDANTLEWLGAAPIFDSGSSLGYDKTAAQILSGKGVECKPFKRSYDEQLRLVTSFEWLIFDRLFPLEQVMREVFQPAVSLVGADRIDAICTTVQHRVKALEEMAISRRQVIAQTASKRPMAERLSSAQMEADRRSTDSTTPEMQAPPHSSEER